MKFKAIFLLGSLFLFACKSKTDIQIKSINTVLKPSYILKKDNVTDNACIKCLSILKHLSYHDSDFIAVQDYKPGIIYMYNIKQNKFTKSFKIPSDNCNIDLFSFQSLDSIVYVNRHGKSLVICDTQKIKFKIKFNNYFNDTNIIVTKLKNENTTYNNMFLLDFLYDANNTTDNYYYDSTNNLNCLGLFKIESNILKQVKIEFKNPNKVSEKKSIINNWIIYTVNEDENKIVYTFKCSNQFYEYNFETKQSKQIELKNNQFKIKTIYYSNTQKHQNDSVKSLDYVVNNQNLTSDFKFNKTTQKYYRHIRFKQNETEDFKYYLQIINSNYEVVSVFEVIEGYYLSEIDGEMYYNHYDAKNKQNVYEKIII